MTYRTSVTMWVFGIGSTSGWLPSSDANCVRRRTLKPSAGPADPSRGREGLLQAGQLCAVASGGRAAMPARTKRTAGTYLRNTESSRL